MKCLRFLCTMLLLLCCVAVHAHDFEVDGIYYNITDATNKTVGVTQGTNKYTGDVVIPESVTHNNVVYSVTSILFPEYGTSSDNGAFSRCEELTSVSIPASVKRIDDYSFYACSNLTSINLAEGLNTIGYGAFYACSNLRSFSLPKSVNELSHNLFNGCKALEFIEVREGNAVYDSRNNSNAIIHTATNSLILGCKNTEIPNTVTSIEGYSFHGCEGLISIVIPSGVTSISESAFSGCSSLEYISVEQGNTVYDSREGCNAIIETATNKLIFGCKSTVLPGNIESIGSYAFSGCSGLTGELTLPAELESIGAYAFSGCSGLTGELTLPAGLKSIGYGAFNHCSGFTGKIVIPSGVTVVEDWSFGYCAGIDGVVVPEGVTSIGYCAFYNTGISGELVIPNSVTSIGGSAFSGCRGLTGHLVIPDGVTDIGESAFSSCSVDSVEIGDGVKIIGGSAFYGCGKLKKLVLGSNVQEIGSEAFNQTALTEVTSKAMIAPKLGENVFFDLNYYWGNDKIALIYPEGANYLEWAKDYFTSPNIESWTEGYTHDDNYKEWYRDNEGNVVVYGKGELTWIPSDAKRLYIKGNITSIGEKVAEWAGELKEVYIEANLSSIGDYAFSHSNLRKIIFPESLTSIGDYAFNECGNLKNVCLPKNLNHIGDYAFYSVPIDVLVIPQFVTSIGNYAFSDVNCMVFKSFVAPQIGELQYGINICVPEGANSYPSSKFSSITLFYPQQEYCITETWDEDGLAYLRGIFIFGNTDNVDITNWEIQSVEYVMFTPDATGYNLVSLLPNVRMVNVLHYNNMDDGYLYTIEGSNAVFKYKKEQAEETILVAGCATTTIPEGTTIIEEQAFSNCAALTTIDIPNSVRSIGYRVFAGCTGLQKITIPSSITNIGMEAFSGCTSLNSVLIPNSVTWLGDCAFEGCTGLKEAVVNGGNLYSGTFRECKNLTRLVIGQNVERIEGASFSGCAELTYITVDPKNPVYDSRDSCNAIIETADNKYVLASKIAVIPESVTSIGSGAFATCADYNLTVPTTVTSIDNEAFSGVNRLYFESENPATINGNVFGYGAIYVPVSAYETYCNADVWSKYKNRIVTTEMAEKSVEVWSTEGMSGILNEIGLDETDKVVKLKVKGEINSYDMIVIRDKMPLLNELDLSEASVIASSKPFYQHYCTGKNSLGGYAFYDLDKLVRVKLPKDLVTLGNYAFYDCNKLQMVDASFAGELNIGAYAFYRCGRLNEFVSPARMSEVGDYAFSGSSQIENIDLRYIAGAIGQNAFEACGKLKTIDIDAIGGHIGEYAFKNCDALTDVTVGAIGGELEAKAFGYCPALKHVTFTQGPTRIGTRAFEFSDALESLVIAEGNTEIADEAFKAVKKVPQYDWGYISWIEQVIDRPNLKTVKLPQGTQSIGNRAFSKCVGLSDFSLPQGLTHIGTEAFSECKALETISFPNGITTIPVRAFEGCESLKSVIFPDELTTIDEWAFSNCAFEKMVLPPTLITIRNNAFADCKPLQELHIPSAVENIGSNSFKGCTLLNAIYTYTIEPTNITETTFSTFTTATLYVPMTSFWNYYWDIGWSRFDHKKFQDFNEPYEYFYLNKDYYLNSSTGYIDGKPNADMRPGSGLIVDKDEEAEDDQQNLGDVTIGSDGNGNSGAIIGDENLHIDNLHVKINVKGGRWYFFAFPWDVPLKKISMQKGSDYVFRHYDGEERAKKGKGGWKNVNESHLKAARGYIFQSSADDVLLISIDDVNFKKEDKYNELITHTSDNMNDASWNLMGNPYLSYYDMGAMNYSAPVTVWDGSKYVAIRPGDDDYQFSPYEAFFVQKPEGTASVGFNADNQMTKTQKETLKVSQAKARLARKIDVQRLLVNLVLEQDSVTDRTRVVFNNRQKMAYEAACDAAKFETEGVLQLYTLDDDGVRYAINERPMNDGMVRIGFTASLSGEYTLDAVRMDTEVVLYDAEMNVVHDFKNGAYAFYSDKGTFEDRFTLGVPNNEATGVEEVELEQVVEVVEGGIAISADATATIYNAAGVAVAKQQGAGTVMLQPGVYVVSVGNKSLKVVVK